MTYLAAETVDVSAPWWQLLTLAGFGLAILGVFAWVRIRTANAKTGFTVAYSRTMGLITLAMLGVVLVATQAPSEVKTGAFTLLGTIAGFFINERAQEKSGTETKSTPVPPPDEGHVSEPTGDTDSAPGATADPGKATGPPD